MDDTVAAEGHEPDLARLAGLEAHRRAGGDVEAHAARGRAVEAQRGVGLVEMVVRADLDRPVAGVGDLEAQRAAARVELDVPGREDVFARLHGVT